MRLRGTRHRNWLPTFMVLAACWICFGAVLGADVEYVGQETCTTCHEDAVGTFGKTTHGRAHVSGWGDESACEACHGPGGAHAGSDGETAIAFTGGAGLDATTTCMSCHGGDVAAHWQSSMHDTFGVSCVDCHDVHQPWTDDEFMAARRVTDKCLTCHNNLRKSMQQRSRHPLKEGLMSCASCHSPHGSAAIAEVSALTPNDKCYQCHAEKRGPYLFPHQPVNEDCAKCHSPHGSNQPSMLLASAPRLCQSCHLFGHHQTVPGSSGQVWNMSRSCVNCHARIHGSNHPSGVIFLR